uniref:Reverse transcriptase zinc-binding domain-containing protein n=1 Tax=Setaria italica TaxID=4555 RepID=K3YEV7_SETIT
MHLNIKVFLAKPKICSKDVVFFECRFAHAVWSVIYAASGLSQPRSVSNMFGSWLRGIGKDLKLLSLWLCRNDIIFGKKYNSSPLQVIFLIIHWLRTWVILQKPASQDLVVAASLRLAQVAKEFFTQAHGWRSSLRIDCQ